MAIKAVLGPNRRNLAAITAVIVILLLGEVFVDQRVIRYAGYLAIFSIWMGWFVLAMVDLMDRTA